MPLSSTKRWQHLSNGVSVLARYSSITKKSCQRTQTEDDLLRAFSSLESRRFIIPRKEQFSYPTLQNGGVSETDMRCVAVWPVLMTPHIDRELWIGDLQLSDVPMGLMSLFAIHKANGLRLLDLSNTQRLRISRRSHRRFGVNKVAIRVLLLSSYRLRHLARVRRSSPSIFTGRNHSRFLSPDIADLFGSIISAVVWDKQLCCVFLLREADTLV